MIFCPHCGIQNPEAARYCDQCGAALPRATASTPTAVPSPYVPPPAARPAPQPGPALTCQQCGAPAFPGEAFCDNCGAPLGAPAGASTQVPIPPAGAAPPQPVYPAPQPAQPPKPSSASAARTLTPPLTRTILAPARLALASGQVIALPAVAEVVIGRADPVSKFFPDVDLSAQGGLDHGVGRRHLRLFVQSNQIMAEDLDSTNGTTLNGQRLPPRQPQPLHDGDQLQLGRLVMRFLY